MYTHNHAYASAITGPQANNTHTHMQTHVQVTVDLFPSLALSLSLFLSLSLSLSAKHTWASGCIPMLFIVVAYSAYKRIPWKKHTAWLEVVDIYLLPLCCYWPAKPKVNELPEANPEPRLWALLSLVVTPKYGRVLPGTETASDGTIRHAFAWHNWRILKNNRLLKPGTPSMLREVMEESLSPSSWSVLGFCAFWSLKSPYCFTNITKQQLIMLGVCHFV